MKILYNLKFLFFLFIIFSSSKSYTQDTLDITDDIVQKIINNSKIILKSGIYSVNRQINIIDSNIQIIGEDNVKIIFKSKNPKEEVLFKIIGNSILIKNITLDGDHKDVYVSLIQIGNSFGNQITENVEIVNCSIQNINGSLIGSDNNYGIRIYLNRSNNVNIESTKFQNISSFDKDQKSGSGGGFCGGIFLFSDQPMENMIYTNKIKISNCYFDSIYTENANKEGWDADGIRFYTNNSNPNKIKSSNIELKNNKFRNIQKSAIKVSGISGVLIKNTTVINETEMEMLCPIRIQWGKNIKVKNTKISGKFEYGFNIIGQNITIDSLKAFDQKKFSISKKIVNYQTNENIENKNIKILKIK